MASAIICSADNQKFNFSMYIFDNIVKSIEGGVKFYLFPRFLQVFLDKQVEGMARHKELYIISSHTKKIFSNMRRIVDDLAGEEVVKETTTGVKDSAALTIDVTEDEVIMDQALAALKSKVCAVTGFDKPFDTLALGTDFVFEKYILSREFEKGVGFPKTNGFGIR
nr:hypothetical protein [Tanacetum cinerariifolium]